MTTVIYHNPDCGTSRYTLAMTRQSGVEPVTVEYLRTPPPRQLVAGLVTQAGLSARQAMRQKGTPHDALGQGDPALTDAQLLDAVVRDPILLNRRLVRPRAACGSADQRSLSSTTPQSRNRTCHQGR